MINARWRYAYRAYGFVGRANAVPSGKQAAKNENKYSASIFKPLIITSLTNNPLLFISAFQQILSKVKQAVN
ncbi:hypothetical protein SS47_15820 [Enterobacter kobei]|nr:hypothetical protein SS47_15820 [Enterobacter kobei]KUQ72605.1 hypothetical protein AWI26_06575 [Enterobacter kobei]